MQNSGNLSITHKNNDHKGRDVKVRTKSNTNDARLEYAQKINKNDVGYIMIGINDGYYYFLIKRLELNDVLFNAVYTNVIRP